MCHLVTVTVLGFKGNARDVFRSYGLEVVPAVNADTRAAMPPESAPFDITQGGCSCSIYVEALSPPVDTAFDEEAERGRYAKKGWSNTKIDRAVHAKKHVHGRKADKAPHVFMSAVAEIVRSGARIALVAHDYSGRFDEESVPVQGRFGMTLGEFEARTAYVPEDTVVTVG